MARTIGGRVRGGRVRISRRVTPSESFRTQVLQRSKFSQNIIQQQRQAKRDADLVNKYIADINAGKISNINQIPQRLRGVIGVTQTELNKINSYVAAKRDADLWKAAFDLADNVLRSSNPGAIFAISFSTNPHAREAYIIQKTNLKAYAERKKSIEAIRRGDIQNVSIVGGRIVDLDTNKFITPSAATAKQFYTTLQKELPSGEVLLKDAKYNITGIKSKLFSTIFKGGSGLKIYDKRRASNLVGFSGSGLTRTQMSNRDAFIKLGIVSETSSLELFQLQPIRTTFFVEKRATPTEVKRFDEIINDKLNQFNLEIRGGETLGGRLLDRINIFKALRISANKTERLLDQWQKTPLNQPAKKKRLLVSALAEKNILTRQLKKIRFVPSSWTGKQGAMAVMSFSATLAKGVGSMPKIAKKIRALEKKIPEISKKTGLISIVKNRKEIISFSKDLWKNRKALVASGIAITASMATAIGEGIKQDVKLFKVSPGRSIGKIGAEIYMFEKTGGKALRIVGRVPLTKARQINPFIKKIKGKKLVIKAAPKEKFLVRGKVRFLKKRVQKPSIKRPISSVADKLRGRKPGQFKKFTKSGGLVLEEQTVKSAALEYSKQLRKYSGKTVTAVNAAADIKPLLGGKIGRLLKLKKVIRKPLLGGKSYLDDYALILAKDKKGGAAIVKLLKKLDKGNQLSLDDVAKLNGWLRKNINPNLSILERSLYLAPESGLRLSRLQISPERSATIRDILTGNFKFRGAKPGVLVFENLKIAKVPKEILRIGDKIAKKGVNYKGFERDWARVTRWSNKIGAKAKAYPGGSPIYGGGIELEVTIPPGEYIKKVKKLTKFLYTDKKVPGSKVIPVYAAEIYRPSKALVKKIKLAKLGKLSKKELAKVERILSKQVKKKVKLETPELLKSKRYIRATRAAARRADTSIPVLRLDRGALKVSAFMVTKGRVKSVRARKVKRKTVKRKTARRPKKVTRPKRKTTTKRTKSITRKVSKRATVRKKVTRPSPRAKPKPRARPRAKRKTPKRTPPRTPPRRPPRRPPVKKPPVRPTARDNKFGKRRLKKKVPVFYIKVRRKGKIVNLNQRPLTLSDAKDYLAYNLDHNTIRSGWFEPLSPTRLVVRLPKAIQGYFGRNKRKLRPYKVRVGKKKAIRNGYIERTKYILDKRGERKQLRTAKRRKPTKKKKVIKRKPVKRRKVVKRKVVKRKRVRKPMKRKIVRRKKKR